VLVYVPVRDLKRWFWPPREGNNQSLSKQLISMCLRLSLFALLLLLSSTTLLAQVELAFEPGVQHLRMLDRHASPLAYQTTGTNLGFLFRKEKNDRLLTIRATYLNSQLEPVNASLFRYNFNGDKNTTAATLAINRLWKHRRIPSLWWGLSASYNALVDFEGVANFPWATLYGDVGLKVRKDLSVGEKISLELEAGLPLVGIVTRQPYNFIPRVEGEEPGVPSLLKLGTKVATWNRYQRLDFSLAGKIELGQHWSLRPAYRFHWARYPEPKVLRLYRQEVVVGLSYKF